ncbi:MAG: hypothetical protein QOF76_4548, partial [Solirubrobacteraceae bacterium]|nr:hypothetical protein [Solirubrobacteraceae bacterium]
GGLLLGGVVAAGAAKTEPGDVVGLTIANGALLTLLGAALSWHVQRSARITTIVVRLTPVALVAAVLLVVGAHHGLRDDLVWSGPWGWAEVALTTTSTAAHVLATALILLLAAIAWVLAWRTAGSCPRERFEARASTRATLSAAAFTADYRSMLTARRSTGTPGRAARIAFGGSQRTIVIWRDVRYLAGTPLRAVSAFGLAFAGGLVAVTNADRAGLVLLGTALLATAGVGLLEPLRIEVDHPDRARILLPWTYGQGLWRHCEAPIAIVSLGVVTSALAAGVAGSAPWGAAGLGVVIGLPAAAVVVLCGAISGRRGGRLPTEKMIGTTGDPTGFSGIGMIGLWLSFWPVFGTIAAAVPALVANASDSPGGPALTGAAINISVAVGLRAYLITKD